MTHIAGKESANDKATIIEEHLHGESNCYPTGAGGVVVTANADTMTISIHYHTY